MITKTKPWKHQQEAYDFCINKPAVGIFMDMGTGKSKVAIDLIVNRNNQKILLVCPKRVIKVWPKQFYIHSDGINVIPLVKGTGTDKAKLVKEYKGPYPVVFVTNYDLIWREPFKTVLRGYGFDCVVIDESHRAKKAGGKASRFLHLLGKITPWKIALSGTPMAHSPLDVYGQYRFLDDTIFGTNYDKFEKRYAEINPYTYKKTYLNQEELSDKVYSIAFRVLADDVLDIPDPIEQNYEVELPPPLMKVYKLLEKKSVLDTQNGLIAVNNSLAQFTRMHQLTSGLSLDGLGGTSRIDSSKAGMLADILEDLPIKEPIVIFAKFVGDLDIIKEVCEKSGRFYSEVSGRIDELEIWQEGRTDVVGVQIQSGSEGEDYTRSRYAIYYSLGFSLTHYLQSRARIDRPGQLYSPVFIHILASKTIDMKIMQALRENKEVIDYIMDEYQKGKFEEEGSLC